jgi:hypothetical protein
LGWAQARLFHFLKVKHNIDRAALWERVADVCLRSLFVTQDVIPHAVRTLPTSRAPRREFGDEMDR